MPGDPTTSNELPEIRASVLLLLLFETCALLLRHYFQGQLLESGRSPSLARDVSWLLVPVTLLFLMWPILRINLTALGAALEIARINLRLIGQAISLGFVLWLSVASVLFTISAFRTGMVYGSAAYHQQPFLSCLPDGSMLLAVVVSVLLTPFVEELLNRGIILRGLIKHGKVFAILLSSLIFGVFHAPQNILIASTVAIFLAIQYLNSGTLWAPIVSHASYNLLVMLDRNCLSGSRALADTSIGTAFVGSAAALLSVMTLGIAIAIVLSCKPVRSQGR